MIRYALPFAALLAISVPAFAKDASPPPPSDSEEKVCRSLMQTGSRMRKRLCLTPAQWKMADEINGTSARDMMSRNTRNETPGG